ncbi:hypothetical protein F183_A10540 [Bryobacterales bacterium F-183]|nr:hypothetical protein F183_A10540 [Bryobacterales bacterium F-183]
MLEKVSAIIGRLTNSGAAVPGRTTGEIERAYDYRTADGTLAFQVVRKRNPKGFFQRRPGPAGEWIADLKGVERVLYNRPALTHAEKVIVLEGEKDCDLFASLAISIVPTTNAGGAGRWQQEYTDDLGPVEVVVAPDNDRPGREHAIQVMRSFLGSAKHLYLAEWPVGKDFAEWWELAGKQSTSSLEEQLAKLVTPISSMEDIERHAHAWGIQASGALGLRSVGAPECPWPRPLGEAAYHGVVGEVVRVIEPHTESDPAALLIQLLVALGNVIGRGPCFRAEADHHYTNLFAVMVGVTSKGRKGTSLGYIRRLLERVAPDWERSNVLSGLSTGEGLIAAVRDEATLPDGVARAGPVRDKRVLILEAEFARVLQVSERDTNTLSAILREAWDSGNLRVMTKQNPVHATGVHASIIGHITKEELKKQLTKTATSNGFANRFLWVCTRRVRSLPEGGNVEESAFDAVVSWVRTAVEDARQVGVMPRDEKARALWAERYEKLSDGRIGLLGSVTSRAEAQVGRIACIYALLDQSEIVREEHLKAALEVWRYCEDSARYIFGESFGNPVADDLLAELRERPDGMNRTEIRDFFNRNKSSASISSALSLLSEHKLVLVKHERATSDQKKPSEIWHAVRD